MKIAVLNDIHLGKALTYPGGVRAASHLVEETLSQLLVDIQKQHEPDLIVNLGDLIRSESREVDSVRYLNGLRFFEKVKCSVIHVLGNHELKKMTQEDVEACWRQVGLKQQVFGSMEKEAVRVVWISLERDKHNPKVHRVPQRELEWLSEVLQTELPTLVLTHCAIDDHDVTGNFFYEVMDNKDTTVFFIENQDRVRKLLASSGCVRGVLQAHLHYFHSKIIDGIPYVTCPALGDNICGPETLEHIPGIFTIVSFTPEQLTVKAYSRSFCFAGTEFSSTGEKESPQSTLRASR